MPALNLPQFLKRYGLQLLTVSNADVLPGAVVDKARKGFMPQGNLRQMWGLTNGRWCVRSLYQSDRQGTRMREEGE